MTECKKTCIICNLGINDEFVKCINVAHKDCVENPKESKEKSSAMSCNFGYPVDDSVNHSDDGSVNHSDYLDPVIAKIFSVKITDHTATYNNLKDNTLINYSNGNLTVWHQNIRSMLSKINDISIVVRKIQPDIICLTETWHNKENIEEMNIQNFYQVTDFARASSSHGGIIIFAKQGIVCQRIDDINNLAKEIDFECAACSVNINNNAICIVCIYRTSEGEIKEFFDRFTNILEIAKEKKYTKLILCGDWNIDYKEDKEGKKKIKKNKEDKKGKKKIKKNKEDKKIRLKKILEQNGIKNKLDAYTRTSYSQIDYLVANFPHSIQNENFKLSDHYGQILTANINSNENTS